MTEPKPGLKVEYMLPVPGTGMRFVHCRLVASYLTMRPALFETLKAAAPGLRFVDVGGEDADA